MQIRASSYMGMRSASITSLVETKIRLLLGDSNVLNTFVSVPKAIFRIKVKVKVTRSFTLVSFERASLVEYACQI